MADKFRVKKGINVQPVVGSTVTEKGDIAYNSSTDKVELYNGAADPLVTEAKAATLTNKTLSGNTAATLISGSGTLTLNTTGTVTVPNATDTLVGKATTDTLTNKTLSGNTATNLVSGSGTLTLNTSGTATVPNATDTLVGKATTDTLTNKSISGSTNTITNVSLATGITGTLPIANGGTGQTGATAAFDALSPLTTKGDIVVHNGTNVVRQGVGTNGQVLVADSSQTNGVKFANAPQGLKNYITVNADLEQGATTGYSLGTATLTNAFPSGAPSFGSGASGNLSLSLISSSQLAGTYSLGYTSSAATTAGNFVATDAFSVDLEGQAKVMQFKVAYSAVASASNGNFSGTSSNSFGVAIYDVTNSAWIQPAGVFNIVQSSGVGIATGTFQTSSNGTSYRLVFFNANATAGAITMYLDDFFVGPQITAAGAAVTDWVAYTPTGSWSTNTSYTGLWKRVGDMMHVQAKVLVSGGAPTSASLSVNLPSGYTIDTAKVIQATVNRALPNSSATIHDSGVSAHFAQICYNNTTSVVVEYISTGNLGVEGAVTQAAPFTFGDADNVILSFAVPIVGWSSNSVMSNDTDTRVIAFTGTSTAGTQTLASGADTLITWTSVVDTAGAFNGTNTYTIPVAGKYRIAASLFSTTTVAVADAFSIKIYKNSVEIAPKQITPLRTTGYSNATFDHVFDFVAGDTVKIYGRHDATTTITLYTNGNMVSIERISGPATIAASESVSATASNPSGTPSNTATAVVWGTADDSTHGNFVSDTYTIPVSGRYEITGAIDVAMTTVASDDLQVGTYKNGSLIRNTVSTAGGANAALGCPIVSGVFSALTGDTITVKVRATGSPRTWNNAGSDNFVSIRRVGN